MTGKQLNKKWEVNAKHALYREDGKWYHNLKKFPGALFDKNGYIVFSSEKDYENCPYLRIRQDLNVPEGISSIPRYIKVTQNESSNFVFEEGKSYSVTLNRYERSKEARKRCIEYYGYSCSACSRKMDDFYGEIAKNFIHVHHLIPLSQIETGYLLDPIKDLRPVCPNCHSIIHLRTPPYSIEEIKKIIKGN